VEALTRAEATVLLSLLGADWNETERSRIRASGIPRSTYQEAKRRLYQEGYLQNRFVPDPYAFGMNGFRFVLARPFVDEVGSVARLLEEDPRTVTLWVSPTALFAVQMVGLPPADRRPDGSLGSAEIPGTVVSLDAAVQAGHIPVFFDLEGVWARVAGASGPRRYPRGVPCPSGHEGETHPPLSPRTAVALRELLARPFDSAMEGRDPARVAAPFLPRSERHVLALGWASWRVLPSFSKRLAHNGRELRQLIFVTGRLQPAVRLPFVTSALARRTGASPLVAATDGTRVILAALGGTGAREGTARPGSVLGTLTATLTDLQIVREDLSTIDTRIDLRFDRLAPRNSASSRD
jgi:hypothetical protein